MEPTTVVCDPGSTVVVFVLWEGGMGGGAVAFFFIVVYVFERSRCSIISRL